MKRSIIETALFLALSVPALAADAGKAEAPPPPAAQTVPASETTQVGELVEKEYYGVKVLLVDPKAGYLGVLFTDEDDESKSEKLSFRVDPDEVDVTNKQNQFLEFSDIVVGSNLDLYTIKGPDGKESVDQIIAYDVNPAD